MLHFGFSDLNKEMVTDTYNYLNNKLQQELFNFLKSNSTFNANKQRILFFSWT
jgi:hypothetical protein